MDKAEREAIARRILDRSAAQQTEISVFSNDSALTRFTRGISNQNVASSDTVVSVRAIVENRTGVAATNRLDERSLSEVVARAETMAQLAPPDPAQPRLPSGGTATTPEGAFVRGTAAAKPEARAEICDTIFQAAEAAGYWCAGYASTSSSGVTVLNSSGALQSFDGTDAAVNVKVTAPDSTGFAESYANDMTALNGRSLGARAVEKARASGNPRSVEPGDWTVILEPAAFGELLAYISDHFSAQSFDDGSSFFSGSLGSRFFGDGVSIFDDYSHPLAPGMPFDFEGQPKMRVPLVENGFVRNVVTDSYYAKKLHRENTGHALPAPNAHGPQPMNLVVAPGTVSSDELIASTKRGLLITRFWYIRTVDQKRAIVTGMTRDGTFLIEEGKIAGGVRNLRFNHSIVESLAHATFANDSSRTSQYSYSIVAPTVKIEGFHFSSTTDF